MNKNINKYSFLIATVALLLDQFSKHVVVFYRAKDGIVGLGLNPKLAVTSFFNLICTFNYGVSFGMFPANTKLKYWSILLISAILLSIVIWWWAKAVSNLEKIACSLVIGGALGNVIDRLQFNAVVDFLDFHVLGYHWPAFNIADSAIVIGIGLLMLHQIFWSKKTN